VKRQMCGRGKLDLLQARMLGAKLIMHASTLRQSQSSTPIHTTGE
jgi:hypothetical protein